MTLINHVNDNVDGSFCLDFSNPTFNLLNARDKFEVKAVFHKRHPSGE